MLGYTFHMRRMTLMLDRLLLDQVTRVLGVKTHSAAVNLALAENLRVRKIQNLPQFFGRGLWQGDLGEMRKDSSKARRPLSRRPRPS